MLVIVLRLGQDVFTTLLVEREARIQQTYQALEQNRSKAENSLHAAKQQLLDAQQHAESIRQEIPSSVRLLETQASTPEMLLQDLQVKKEKTTFLALTQTLGRIKQQVLRVATQKAYEKTIQKLFHSLTLFETQRARTNSVFLYSAQGSSLEEGLCSIKVNKGGPALSTGKFLDLQGTMIQKQSKTLSSVYVSSPRTET